MVSKIIDKTSKIERAGSNLARGLATLIRSHHHDAKLTKKVQNYRLMRKRALLYARAELEPTKYGLWLDQFRAQQLFEFNTLRGIAIGKDDLAGVIAGPNIPLNSEVLWLGEWLGRSSEEINSYLGLERELNAVTWGPQPEKALEVLKAIETKHGLSIKLITDAIAINQLINGISGQKKYLNTIKIAFKRGLVPYLAHYISVRNEPTVSWAWYSDNMVRRVNNMTFDDGIKSYLKYHFTGQWPTSLEEVSNILKTEQSHSNIDVYNTFISFLRFTLTNVNYDKIRGSIGMALKAMAGIEDPRLDKLRIELGLPCDQHSFTRSTAADKLLRGKSREAYRDAILSLRSDPTAVHDAVVASFARAGTKHTSNLSSNGVFSLLWTKSIPDLATLFRKDQDFTGALDRILKLGINFGGTDCGRALAAIASVEGEPEIVPDVRKLKMICFCTGINSFLESRAGIVAHGATNDLPSRFFVNAINDTRLDEYHPIANAYSKAVKAAVDQQWEATTHFCDVVKTTQHIGLRARATLLGMSARLRLNQLDNVIFLIEKVIESDSVTTSLLPYVSAIEGMTWSELRESAGRIGLAITLDLALKTTGDDRTATNRRFAFDEFLLSRGVSRASELVISEYNSRTLSYFLRNIAVPSVLDMSDALESSKAIQEERRSILSILTHIDAENASEYQDEILKISDALEVAEGLKIVDSSRIHVDIDVIEDWSKRELMDSYSRYRVLLQSGIGIAEDFDTFLEKLNKIDDRSKYKFAIPDNEADELLVTIIRSLLKEFLYAPAHGLDSYLSRRIRHGSIVGFLRGPVEETRLVTLRDEHSNLYLPNVYWIDKLADLSESEREIISEALTKFTKLYDEELIKLRDELLQIRDRDHPNGIFKMQLFDDQYHFIRSIIKESDSFSLFVTACFGSFWVVLDRSLQSARNYVKDDLRAALGSAFEDLRATVNRLHQDNSGDNNYGIPKPRKGLTQLNNALTTSQNSLQGALENVATWFIRSELQLAKRQYTLQEAANIASASALARLRTYDPSIEMSIDEKIAVSSTELSIIADIMLICLGNACEHSGMNGRTDIYVSIQASDDHSQLIFRISNSVTPEALRRARNDVLDSIRKEVESGSVTDSVRKDRGSGLRKLGAMSAMKPNSSLDFGFTDDSRFSVTLRLSFNCSISEARP